MAIDLEAVSAWYRRIRARLSGGGGTQEAASEKRLANLWELPHPTALAEAASTLPSTAQAAFSFQPLTADSPLFVGRDAALQTAERLIQRWRDGQPAALALHGPNGCGMTSLLLQLAGRFARPDEVTLVSLDRRLCDAANLVQTIAQAAGIPDAPQDTATLASRLNEAAPRIMLVDNGHWLYLRTRGMDEAVRTFIALMLATQDHILWIFGCGEQAWRRLGFVFDFQRYFSEAIELGYFDAVDFAEAMRRRIAAAGAPLAYVDPDSEEAQPDYAPPEEAFDEGRIDKLRQIAGGNLRAALYYWHCGLSHHPPHGLSLRPCARLDFSPLRDLPQRHLLSLTEILAHGGLTLAEHGALFHSDPAEDRLLLDYLHGRRILERRPTGDADTLYWVDPILYGPLKETLVTAHMLY